jgi:hypothetical protein
VDKLRILLDNVNKSVLLSATLLETEAIAVVKGVPLFTKLHPESTTMVLLSSYINKPEIVVMLLLYKIHICFSAFLIFFV